MARSIAVVFTLLVVFKRECQTFDASEIARNCVTYTQCKSYTKFQYCSHRMNVNPMFKMEVFCENLEGHFCLAMNMIWSVRYNYPTTIPEAGFSVIDAFALQLDEMCRNLRTQIGMLFFDTRFMFAFNGCHVKFCFLFHRSWERTIISFTKCLPLAGKD